MQRFEEKIDAALSHLSRPGILNATGDRPICYVTYPMSDALSIQSKIESELRPKAIHFNFTMYVLSMADVIKSSIRDHDYYSIWNCEEDITEEDLFQSIKTEIQNSSSVASAISAKIDEHKSSNHPLLIIKDLEWLHPFDKIGRIEQIIYKHIDIPVLVLYPGEIQGNARTFMGIYPMDGNYRSKNF